MIHSTFEGGGGGALAKTKKPIVRYFKSTLSLKLYKHYLGLK